MKTKAKKTTASAKPGNRKPVVKSAKPGAVRAAARKAVVAKPAKAVVKRPAAKSARPVAVKPLPAAKVATAVRPAKAVAPVAPAPARPSAAKAAAVPPRGRNHSLLDTIPDFRGAKKKRYDSLIQLREELTSQFRDLSSASLSYQKEAGEDLADIGSENFARDLSLALMSEEGTTITLIQDAICRLIDGSYGTCIDCNGKISDARLDAIPYAKLCVKCKEVREEEEDEIPEVEEVEEEVVE